MRFRGSLAARVSLLAAVAVGLSVALLASVAYLSLQHQLVRSVDESLYERASEMSQDVSPSTLADGRIPPWLLDAADVRIAFLYADGTGGYRPAPGQEGDITLRQPEFEVANGERAWSLRTVDTEGGRYRVCAVPGLDPGSALVLAQSLEPMEKTLGKLGVVLVLAGLMGVVAAAFAGWAVARNGLAPVRRLTDAAEEIARTDELRPITVEGEDEIARLATAFNSMLAALSASRDRQRQLVADAGHELRTPLTSLRTNIDLLAQADRRGGLSEEQRGELMDDVRFQIDELTSLIGDLTELARDEPIQTHLEALDLADPVARAVDRVRRRTNDVTFEVSLYPSPVTGEPDSLERAVTNLLDNAVKWSPRAGVVTVSLRDGLLYVADQGPGIAEEDLPHVFERFYRSTESRTMPGSGLGLSIVQRIAHRHGGVVHAGRAQAGGAAFWFRLPLRATDGDERPTDQVTEPSQRPLRGDSASVDTLES
jgi:two-component system, OmpR family, sensor histidine kinase MprB